MDGGNADNVGNSYLPTLRALTYLVFERRSKMIDRTSLERNIGDIFGRKLHLTVPSAETDLFESGSLDSLSCIELLLQVELEYGIRIPLQDLELSEFRSIGRIAGFIKQRLDANPRQSALVEAKCQL
jgi:acyl carrier protein